MMKIESESLEQQAVMAAAASVCAAARTAPKTKGVDFIHTCVLTGGEKDALADEMERLAPVLGYPFFIRDAGNVRSSHAVVLIGTTYQAARTERGLRILQPKKLYGVRAGRKRMRLRQYRPWHRGRFRCLCRRRCADRQPRHVLCRPGGAFPRHHGRRCTRDSRYPAFRKGKIALF